MNSSTKIESLAAALCKAQSEMGGAVKDSANPFFKSRYADLTSVIKAIKQPFADNGLSYTQFPISNEHGTGVVTRLMHNSGEWLESEFVLPMVKKDPQAAGSCISYARRYSLMAMAGCPTADDDGESAMMRGYNPNKAGSALIKKISDLIEQTGVDETKLLKAYKIDYIEDLDPITADQVIKILRDRV